MGRRPRYLIAALLLATGSAQAQAPAPVRGFDEAGSSAQRVLEQRLQSLASAESIRGFHRELTRAPHPATSARTREIAEFIADTWRAQGLDEVRVHRYDVLSSNPREVSVEMLAPRRYVPSLREDPLAADPDSAHPQISGAWASFSASGDVTAPVVYANSGNPADYAVLRANGIDVRGKIVIVRYSNPYSYRGFKALTAEREGAAAILIYSDPQEDGHAKGTVYPDGPWGPASHLQRGGVAYDYIVPGDHGGTDVAPLHPAHPRGPRGARRAGGLARGAAHHLSAWRCRGPIARAHRHADRHPAELRRGRTPARRGTAR